MNINHELAEIAQLGERQTENLNVPGSIPGFGKIFIFFNLAYFFCPSFYDNLLVKKLKKPKLLTHFYFTILKNFSIPFVANGDKPKYLNWGSVRLKFSGNYCKKM